MNEWKHKVGDVLPMGRNNKLVINGTKEEVCPGGIQRFYSFYNVISDLGRIACTTQPIWVPDIVLDVMVEMERI